MSKGYVDGSVRDRVRGAAVLSLMLEVVRPGSVVIVSSLKVTVDKSRCAEYTQEDSEQGQVTPLNGS